MNLDFQATRALFTFFVCKYFWDVVCMVFSIYGIDHYVVCVAWPWAWCVLCGVLCLLRRSGALFLRGGPGLGVCYVVCYVLGAHKAFIHLCGT